MQFMTKEHLLESLRNGVVNVTFTKADGTTRTMNATLNEEYIVENSLQPKGNNTQSAEQDVFRVVDVNLNQWRSFKYDSLTEVK